MSTIVMMETQITDANERRLVAAFDNALENIKTSNAEAGKIARELKEQYVYKGKRVAGQGWKAFLESRTLNVDLVDSWILSYERREGIRPPRPSQASSRTFSGTNYRPDHNKDYTSPPDAVREYYERGKDEKGNTMWTQKGPGWDEPDLATVAQETGTDAQIDAAVEKIQDGASVEWVAVQIADLI